MSIQNDLTKKQRVEEKKLREEAKKMKTESLGGRQVQSSRTTMGKKNCENKQEVDNIQVSTKKNCKYRNKDNVF